MDYASTRWRPDLQPLPCDQTVLQQIDSDGRHSYTFPTALQSGTILGTFICTEVPVTVLDQFPVLKDFVLTGQMGKLYTGLANKAALAHTQKNTPLVSLQTPAGNLNGYLYCISQPTLLQCLNLQPIKTHSTAPVWNRNMKLRIHHTDVP